jgi:hypothetical protein
MSVAPGGLPSQGGRIPDAGDRRADRPAGRGGLGRRRCGRCRGGVHHRASQASAPPALTWDRPPGCHDQRPTRSTARRPSSEARVAGWDRRTTPPVRPAAPRKPARAADREPGAGGPRPPPPGPRPRRTRRALQVSSGPACDRSPAQCSSRPRPLPVHPQGHPPWRDGAAGRILTRHDNRDPLPAQPAVPRRAHAAGSNAGQEAWLTTSPGLRRRSSANWVEFEDTSALGRFHRMVEIDTIDDANEPDTERNASRVRTEDVAKEANSLCRVQLGRAYFFSPAAHRDRRAAGGAEIAHPLDLAPGGPDPAPASYLNDRQGRGARQAAVPATNGEEPIGTHRHASDQKELQDSAEDPDPPWHLCTLRHRHFLAYRTADASRLVPNAHRVLLPFGRRAAARPHRPPRRSVIWKTPRDRRM